MPLKIPNYGDWAGDKEGGHHPPACTCYGCNEERRRLEASKEEERRAAEYDRRVAQTRAQGRSQGQGRTQGQGRGPRPPGRNSSPQPSPTRRPPHTPPPRPQGTGRDHSRRRRGPSLRLWLGFLVVAVALVAVIFYVNNPDILAPLQGGEPAAVAALAPTEEPRTTSTPIPTPEPEVTVALASPTLVQLRSQPVPSQTMESASASPALGPTVVSSLEDGVPPTAIPLIPPTPAPPSLASPVPTPSSTTVPAPTLAPTTVPSPIPIPAPHLRHLAEKEYMLELINQERERAGVPPVELGTNNAAQLHAESALEHCFSAHWGVDGLKPYMRYSLAGGYQSNGENGSGLDYCYKASDGYRALQSIDLEIREMMDGWMDSPGHRRNLLRRWHKKVNIGLAWDRYNLMGYQHFEGDYVEYGALPTIEDGEMAFEGRTRNGAVFGQGNVVHVEVLYDAPPDSLTRGQLSRTYCYAFGLPVAYLREPLTGGWSYPNDTLSTTHTPCPDPYRVSADASPPRSPSQAHTHWRQAYTASQMLIDIPVLMEAITASKWKVNGDGFSITADLSDILDAHGPGVYMVVLWGTLGGGSEIISQYAIFHEVPAPSGYD